MNTGLDLRLAKRFVTNQIYWDLLSESQKAYTIIHEALYEALAARGAKDSRLIRYLVGMLISELFQIYTIQD